MHDCVTYSRTICTNYCTLCMSDRPNYIKPNHRGDRANYTRTIAMFGWLRTIDTEIVELCRIIYKEAGANYMLTGSATENKCKIEE